MVWGAVLLGLVALAASVQAKIELTKKTKLAWVGRAGFRIPGLCNILIVCYRQQRVYVVVEWRVSHVWSAAG